MKAKFLGKSWRMKRRTLIFASFLVSSPALAEMTYPVPVPQDCTELAQREGVPLMIENRYQALKAQYKLAKLSGRDPLVRQCRAAIAIAKKAAAQYATTRPQAVQASASAPRSEVQ
jgi:hypothetical protein